MDRVHEIWLIDDSKVILSTVSEMLTDAGYSVSTYKNPMEAYDRLLHESPHIIISDIIMPEMDGITFLERIHKLDCELPVILITSSPSIDVTVRAIRSGAFDFIIKPITLEPLLFAVNRALKFCDLMFERRGCKEKLEDMIHERTRQLHEAILDIKKSKLETIHTLTKATEFRDNETGSHIKRIGMYSHRLSQAIGAGNGLCEEILYASPIHDIGKIGIPDSLLLKKGPLSKVEYGIMKRHTEIGARMLSGNKSSMLKMAKEIALYHHERCDGSGYPRGFKRTEIPLTARIVMLADQYDALRSERPYKNEYSHAQTYEILTKGDGRTIPSHFDPTVLDAFKSIEDDFNTIFSEGKAVDFDAILSDAISL